MSEENNYGEFEEVIEEGAVSEQPSEIVPVRAKTPGKGEYIGVILQRLGGNRMEVKATDGKIRNCRVPGRFKRSMWLRPKDHVIIKPWSDDDSKADVIFKYNSAALNQLRKKGLLNSLRDEF